MSRTLRQKNAKARRFCIVAIDGIDVYNFLYKFVESLTDFEEALGKARPEGRGRYGTPSSSRD